MRLLNKALLRMTTWVRREEGQTLVEYGLIIALVAIALVLSLQFLAGGIDGVFQDIVGNF